MPKRLGRWLQPTPSGENILWTQRIEKEAGPGNGYGMVLVFWFAKCSLSRQACWWNVECRWMMMNVEVWDFFTWTLRTSEKIERDLMLRFFGCAAGTCLHQWRKNPSLKLGSQTWAQKIDNQMCWDSTLGTTISPSWRGSLLTSPSSIVINVDKTMSWLPSPSHHHFYRWYKHV
jgi:hypothetical protein